MQIFKLLLKLGLKNPEKMQRLTDEEIQELYEAWEQEKNELEICNY